ncbi:hypothetical protein VTH06DRAFT_2768 [Thermothelomyces fergusii]
MAKPCRASSQVTRRAAVGGRSRPTLGVLRTRLSPRTGPPPPGTMQKRREEILAKRAKLAELKRQRELRASQANRSSVITPGEVGLVLLLLSLAVVFTSG